MITRKIPDKLVGLSTDTKPTNVDNGTKLFCMDSKKTYIFDKAGATWYEYVDPDAPSGGGLPEVTADDNGDVLTVVEGAWAKAAPSGGGVLVVHVVYDQQTEIATLDKTWQEIADAECVVIRWSANYDPDVEIGYENVISITSGNSNYDVVCFTANITNFGDESCTPYLTYYRASSADGYPTRYE